MASGSGDGSVTRDGPTAPFFRRSHLYAMAALATVYLFVSALYPVAWVELPLGLLTLLIVPGYAIGWIALGPQNRWPWSLTFALVVGWSVGVNVAAGIVLLLLHRGLPPVILGGCAFVLIGIAASVESFRTVAPSGPARTSELARGVRLTGFRRGQRAAAYGLLGAILVVLAIVVLIASSFPNSTPALAFSITGFGGTSANLPPSGIVNQTLDIEAIVQNNATPQSFVLVVESATVGSNPPSYRAVSWVLPLVLGNAISASDPVKVVPGQQLIVDVPFLFPQSGDYVLTFLLESPGATVVGRATWTVVIS